MPNLVANKDKKQTQYKIVVGGAPQVNTGVKNNKSASQNARENARGVDLRASSPQTARTNTQAKNVITSTASPGTAHAPTSAVQTPVLNAAQQRFAGKSTREKAAMLDLRDEGMTNGRGPAVSMAERIGRILAGAGESRAAGHVNTLGMLSDAQRGTAMSGVYQAQADTLDQQISVLQRIINDPTSTPQDRAEAREALEVAQRERGIYGGALRSGQNTAQEVYRIADSLARRGQANTERAKEGLGAVGRVGVDLASQGVQMAGDRLVGGPFSLAAMGARTFGSGAQEARQEGASLPQAAAYGAASAAVEMLTEKMFDGLAGIYGKGAADDISRSVINRLTASEAGRRALTIAAAAGGEASEEAVSGYVNPWLKSIYNGQRRGLGRTREELADMAYDMLIGGIMGGIGGTVEAAGVTGERRADAQRRSDTQHLAAAPRNTSDAGTLTVESERGAQAQEMRESGAASVTPADIVALSNGQPTARQVNEIAKDRAALARLGIDPNGKTAAQLRTEVRAALEQSGKVNTVDNAANPGYNISVNNGGDFRGGTELDGSAGAGVWDGRGSKETDPAVALGGSERQGNLSDAPVVLLSQKARDTLQMRGIVPVEVFSSTDKAAFSSLLNEARANDTANGWAVTPKSEEELAGCRAYLSSDGGVGFAVAQDGDLEAVFRNRARNSSGRTMRSVLPQAIAAGAIKGDCYGPRLVNIYEQGGGFRPVCRVEFNPDYANDGWTPDKGTPYIYFLMATDTNPESVAENQLAYHLSTQAELDALPTFGKEDYEKAYAYRDSLLEQQRRAGGGESGDGDFGSATGAAEAGFSHSRGEQVPTQDRTVTDSPYMTMGEREQFAPGTHERISEAQSIERAREQFYNDSEGNLTHLEDTIRTLLDKDLWLGEDQDAAQMAMMALLERSRTERAENGQVSEETARLLQELSEGIHRIGGTLTAQSLQARQKWVNTPGDIVSRAQQLLERAREGTDRQDVLDQITDMALEFDDALENQRWNDLAGIIRRTSQIRRTGSLFGNRWSRTMNGALDRVVNRAESGDEAAQRFLEQHCANGLVAIAGDYEPVGVGEGVLTARRNAMLSKISTTMRNLVSNNVFDIVDSVSRNISVPLDRTIARITGTRSVAADRSWFSPEKRRASMEALDCAILETGLDVDASGETGRYENGGQRTYTMNGGVMSRLMSTWEKWLGYRLYATDQFQKGGISAEVQRGLDELYDRGQIADESLRHGGDTEARYRTFQDETAISRMAVDARHALNDISVGGVGLGDIAIPFAQVPSNLASRALEYSPAGIARGMVQLGQVLAAAHNGTLTAAQQAQAVQSIGRGMNGTALIAGAAALALKGVLHVADLGDDEDKDKRALEQQSGISGTQLNLSALRRWADGGSAEWQDGDELLSIGFLDPINANLTTGALIARDVQESGEWTAGGVALNTLSGAVQAVLDIPVMSTLKDAAEAYRYSNQSTVGQKALDAAKEFGASQVTSFIPNSIKGVAQGLDDTQRDTYAGDTLGERTKNQIKAAIPGLRKTLPAKLDSYGQERKNDGGVRNFLNANVNPGSLTRYQRPQSKVTQELDRLSDKLGDNTVYPNRKAPNSFSAGGTKYELNTAEKRKYQKTAGAAFLELADKVIEGAKYQQLSDEQKADALAKIVVYSSAKARQEAIEARGGTYDLTGEARTVEKATEAQQVGVDPSEYFWLKGEHDKIDKRDLSANEKATYWAKFLVGQGWLNERQREKIGELQRFSGGYYGTASDKALGAEENGISLDQYFAYKDSISGLQADKDANGKSISGSKKAKVIAAINELDMTPEQKDFLYLEEGYKKADLYKTPWH